MAIGVGTLQQDGVADRSSRGAAPGRKLERYEKTRFASQPSLADNKTVSDFSQHGVIVFSIHGKPARLCDGFSRREVLRVGGLGALGLSSGRLESARREALAAANPARLPGFGKARSCIVLFLLGGPPQHETWDPKPAAPAEIRGDFKPIASAVTGLHVGEMMPKTAALADRVSVLRAVATDDNAHSASGYWMLTGTPHQPKNVENAGTGAPNDWPCLAGVVRHLRGDAGRLPTSIRLPEEIWNTGHIVWPGQDAGRLGAAADPWLITCDPNADDFEVPQLALPSGMPVIRLRQRQSLLATLNAERTRVERIAAVRRWRGLGSRTFDLLQSDQARRAFAIEKEPVTVRDRYGRNRFGQSVLLARRLVEEGVSLVQVNWTRWKHDQAVAPAWDTHAENSQRLKKDLMPPMDLAYSALLEDLEQRGLLDETLVVWMGEFGRTPRINKRGGRDHWGHVFPVALAGGGIQPGRVFGASDRQGAFPQDGRVEPQDLLATIFHCLGHAPQTQVRDKLGRPLVISQGQVIEALL